MDLDHSGGLSTGEIRAFLGYFLRINDEITDHMLRTAFFLDQDSNVIEMIIAQIEFREFLIRIFKRMDTI